MVESLRWPGAYAFKSCSIRHQTINAHHERCHHAHIDGQLWPRDSVQSKYLGLPRSSHRASGRLPRLPKEVLHQLRFDRIEVDNGTPIYVFAPKTDIGVSAEVPLGIAADVSVRTRENKALRAPLAHINNNPRRWSFGLPSQPNRRLEVFLSVHGRKIASWNIRVAPSWRHHLETFSVPPIQAKDAVDVRYALQAARAPSGWRRYAMLLALSRIDRSMGATNAVRDLFEEMLNGARELNSPSEEAASYRRLAFIETLTGDFDSARQHLEHSARITQRWRDVVGQTLTWRALGVLMLRAQLPGAAAEATQLFRKCRRSAQRLGDIPLASMCAVYEASALAQHESVSQARQLSATIPKAEQQCDIWKVMRVFVEYHAFEALRPHATEHSPRSGLELAYFISLDTPNIRSETL